MFWVSYSFIYKMLSIQNIFNDVFKMLTSATRTRVPTRGLASTTCTRSSASAGPITAERHAIGVSFDLRV